MEATDQIMKCVEPGCGQEFIFTAGEQNFFHEKFGDSFTPPKRCKSCRTKRRSAKEGGSNYRTNEATMQPQYPGEPDVRRTSRRSRNRDNSNDNRGNR